MAGNRNQRHVCAGKASQLQETVYLQAPHGREMCGMMMLNQESHRKDCMPYRSGCSHTSKVLWAKVHASPRRHMRPCSITGTHTQ